MWTKVPFGCTSWAHRPLGVMLLNLAYRTGVPWNESAYSNPEFDQLLNQAGGISVEQAGRGDGEARGDVADGRADGAAGVRQILHLHGQEGAGVSMHPTANYLFGNKLALAG